MGKTPKLKQRKTNFAMQMPHGHLFRNHTPWAQRLMEARTCSPASQGFGISIAATHKAQAVQIHPKKRHLPPSTPERDRLGR